MHRLWLWLLGVNWNWVLRPRVALHAWRLRRMRAHEVIPPELAQFREGEVLPLKGVRFRVSMVRPKGIVIEPIGFTRRSVHNKWARIRTQFRADAKEADRVEEAVQREAVESVRAGPRPEVRRPSARRP